MNKIIKELESMWDGTDKKSVVELVDRLCRARDKKIVGLGAGRMGYAIQAFVMRLSHLGYRSYMVGDTTLPRVDSDTFVIVNTSSGETSSMKLYVDQCREAGSFIVAVTAGKKSTIALKADLMVSIPKIDSDQLMKTIYEQYSFLLFDYVSSKVFEKSQLNKEWVEQNHSILE